MDEDLGKTFKKVRESKNIPAKEVASEVFSYSQLMKFEQGKTSITVEKLELVDRLISLNLSVKEFERAYQNEKHSDELFFHNYI